MQTVAYSQTMESSPPPPLFLTAGCFDRPMGLGTTIHRVHFPEGFPADRKHDLMEMKGMPLTIAMGRRINESVPEEHKKSVFFEISTSPELPEYEGVAKEALEKLAEVHAEMDKIFGTLSIDIDKTEDADKIYSLLFSVQEVIRESDDIFSRPENILNCKGELDILQKYDDSYTYGHSLRVAAISFSLLLDAEKVGIRPPSTLKERVSFVVGCLLHDIGKVFVDRQILNKDAPLSNEERDLVKYHPDVGKAMIMRLENSLRGAFGDMIDFDIIQEVVGGHHQDYNGEGRSYGDPKPGRKVGEATPEEIRKSALEYCRWKDLAHIGDVFDAISGPKRVYQKRPLTMKETLDIIQKGAGTEFDPALVELMHDTFPRYSKGEYVVTREGLVGQVAEARREGGIMLVLASLTEELKNLVGETVMFENEDIAISSSTLDDLVSRALSEALNQAFQSDSPETTSADIASEHLVKILAESADISPIVKEDIASIVHKILTPEILQDIKTSLSNAATRGGTMSRYHDILMKTRYGKSPKINDNEPIYMSR